MKDSRQEIQVGLAIIAAVVVLVAGLMWFQGYRYDRDSVRVTVQFPAVGGLGAGDPVHVRGIPLGKVESVGLDGTGVRVELRLQGEVPLRAIIAALDARGFAGFFSFKWEKIWNANLPDARTALPRFLAFMRSI